MTRKTIVLMITTLITIAIIAFIIKQSISYYTWFHPIGGTGGIVSEAKPEDLTEGNAINNLQKKLPFVTNEFIISSFNYKTAKFQVELKGIAQEQFFEWLKASDFASIPEKRFDLTP